MKDNFIACLHNFTLLPGNDGQPFHVDSGGGTSYGVTRANWSRWIKHPASDADMEAITAPGTTQFYEAWYWKTISGDALPLGVDLMVFDHGIMSGEATSARALQQVVRSTVDGWVGLNTLAQVAKLDPSVLIGMLAWRQEEYYRSLDSFTINGNGWLARLDRRVIAATGMLRKTP
jgi:lysozyme family protein